MPSGQTGKIQIEWVGNLFPGCTHKKVIKGFYHSILQVGFPRGQYKPPHCSTSSEMVWTMRQKAPVPSLLVTLNCVVRWTRRKNHLTVSWTGWKSGLARTVQNLTKTSVKFWKWNKKLRVQYRPGFVWCMTNLAEGDLVQDEQESAGHCCSNKSKSEPGLHLWGHC